ncbi:MAG: FAD-dependent oxidoreductase [Hyphomicrobiaceae bacterium]|nr:FAD-dependent oxidoreductase [Hyphomicrobiaceae bacterium]
MTDRVADIVIVGGAAVGSSIAYFLGRDGFKGRVVVVEKDPSYQWCASGRAVAGIRQQFSTPENIRLSQFGVGFFRGIKSELGPEADIAFRERGYMVMATPEGRATLEANVRLQRNLGADTELLDPAEVARRFPWLSVEGLGGAGWGRSGEGWVDPASLMQLFRKAAMARGADYVHDEVVGIETGGGRIDGVRLASGARVSTGTVVCAAGWHSANVAAMAGLSIPVRPRKRFVFVVDCPTPLPGAGLMIDPSGLYFRPEGRFFLTGIAPPEDQDPDAEDFDIDHDLFQSRIWPALAARVPAMETLKVQNAWCCHYDVNTLDHNAILGCHPDLPSFVMACGFSGHGLQHSPGVGRAMAELVMHGAYRTIDVTRLGFQRVVAGRPLREANVY